MAADSLLTLDDVRAAAQRLAGRIDRTPVLTSAALDDASGCHVFLKCENLQRAGSFKIRGALNKLLGLSAAERTRGVVAYSSGNHAPVVAPSANQSGHVSPTTAAHARADLDGRIDLIIDGGATSVGIESTIVSCL